MKVYLLLALVGFGLLGVLMAVGFVPVSMRKDPPKGGLTDDVKERGRASATVSDDLKELV
jgi:Serpin (serine protease inhibitor)